MTEDWKDFLKAKRREILVLTLAGAAVLVLVLSASFIDGSENSYVPEEYSQARVEAIGVSREIVSLSNGINQSLAEITVKNDAGDYSGALTVAKSGADRTNQIGIKAEELLGALERMVESVDGVRPTGAISVGKEAIAVGIKIVERLVVYSNLSSDLIRKIEAKLSGENVKEAEITRIIDKINEEVQFINTLNSNYQTLTEEFDNLTGVNQ
ncbi:MAG: hypothetical protein PHV43_03290 [Candidatus Colwellbacteria bacterium]|nr:hypothetical protein [Candidatus Colwellbacteria bacterium]